MLLKDSHDFEEKLIYCCNNILLNKEALTSVEAVEKSMYGGKLSIGSITKFWHDIGVGSWL